MSYLPLLKLDLHLTDQLISPLFFVSFVILIFSWALSGPMTAAFLTVAAALVSVYLALSLKEPSFLFQVLIYAGLFIVTVFYLLRIQKDNNDKLLAKEKLLEDIHLLEEESEKDTQLSEALEGKISRFKALQNFSEELKGLLDLEMTAKRIVKEAKEALPQADNCLLFLVDESQEILSLLASTHAKNESIKEKEGTLFDQWVMKKGQGLTIEDTLNDFRFPHEIKTLDPAIRSFCASPLVTEKRVLGVLRASSRKVGAFSADDLRLMDIFSGLCAVTLRNILLYRRMDELAIRDGLTGLYLNRYFHERLNEEIQRALYGKGHFSLLMLDIDFFKRFNDEYGHAAGDIVLKNTAALIKQCLEPGDFVARYGGEEFVALLPGKNGKQAFIVAEKIRKHIERSKITLRRGETRLTASVGVSVFPDKGRTKEELLWAADQCLYKAKKSGRNKVVA